MPESDDYTLSFDFYEITKRALKYLIEGLAVAVAAYLFPRKKMDLTEILTIALTASTVFAILDMYAPSVVAHGARWGAGFGIGAQTVGALPAEEEFTTERK